MSIFECLFYTGFTIYIIAVPSYDLDLQQLPDPLSCYIDDVYPGVSCCADIGFLRRGFSAYVWLDSCNGRLIAGVDNFKRNISLSSYQYGMYLSFSCTPDKDI